MSMHQHFGHIYHEIVQINLRNNNNNKIMQPIEYKLTIPNTFHIERVNHYGLP